MAIRIREFDAGFGVFIEGRGIVSDEEYAEHMTANLTEDMDKLRGYVWSLSDYSGASRIAIKPVTLARVASLSAAAAEQGVNAAVAVVVPSSVAYGLPRMFEVQASFTDWNVQTFKSLPEAVEWIRRTVGDQYCSDLIASFDADE